MKDHQLRILRCFVPTSERRYARLRNCERGALAFAFQAASNELLFLFFLLFPLLVVSERLVTAEARMVCFYGWKRDLSESSWLRNLALITLNAVMQRMANQVIYAPIQAEGSIKSGLGVPHTIVWLLFEDGTYKTFISSS